MLRKQIFTVPIATLEAANKSNSVQALGLFHIDYTYYVLDTHMNVHICKCYDSRYNSVTLGLRISNVIIYKFLCMNVVTMCLTRKHLLICLME